MNRPVPGAHGGSAVATLLSGLQPQDTLGTWSGLTPQCTSRLCSHHGQRALSLESPACRGGSPVGSPGPRADGSVNEGGPPS